MVRRNILVYVRALDIHLPRFNKKYLALIRDMSCIECGRWKPSEASHPLGAIWGSGGRLKAPDETAIPHCGDCHRKYHRMEESWEERLERHIRLLKKTWRRLGFTPETA